MITISQRIAALQAERGTHVRNYETAVNGALEAERELSEPEQATVTEARGEIERLDTLIRSWTEHETALVEQARAQTTALVPHPGSSVALATQRERPHIQMRRQDAYPGCDFVRMAIAISVAGHWNAAEYAYARWGDEEFSHVIRAHVARQWDIRAPVPPVHGLPPPGITPPGGAAGASVGGQFLVRLEHLGQEFIEMLRPMLIVGRMPSMRRLSFNNAGTLRIPRQTGGVIGGYVGEGNSIVVNNVTFGELQLTPSKLAVIVPATSELLRRADPSLEMIIRDDILAGTARTVDSTFFRNQAAPNPPAPASILFNIPINEGGVIPANAPTAVTDVTLALKNMILAHRLADSHFNSPVWIMHARTKEYIRLLRTQGTEIFAFKAEIDAGTLLGYPIIDTTNIAIPFVPADAGPPIIGATNAGYALIDASQVLWADDMAPIIDASSDASIQMDNTPATPPATPYWSAFQNDMILMRLRMSHTWNRRHDVAITWSVSNE